MGRCLRISSGCTYTDLVLKICQEFGVSADVAEVKLTYWIGNEVSSVLSNRRPPICIDSDLGLVTFMGFSADVQIANLYVSFANEVINLPRMRSEEQVDDREKESDVAFSKDGLEGLNCSLDDDVLLQHVSSVERMLEKGKGKQISAVDEWNESTSEDEDDLTDESGGDSEGVDPFGDVVMEEEDYESDFWEEYCLREPEVVGQCVNDRKDPEAVAIGEELNDRFHDQTGNENDRTIVGATSVRIGSSSTGNAYKRRRDNPVFEGCASEELGNSLALAYRNLDDAENLFLRDAEPVFDEVLDICNNTVSCEISTMEDTLYVGRKFRNKAALKLNTYAVKWIFSYRCPRSNPKRLLAVCADSNCKWMVNSRVIPKSSQFKIKNVYLAHTCDVITRGKYGKHADRW